MAKPEIPEPVICNKCGSENVIKSGMSRDKQRYHCKDCRSYFVPPTQADNQRLLANQKAAMLLYLGGATIGEIEKALDISYPTVIKLIGPLKKLFEEDPQLELARKAPLSSVSGNVKVAYLQQLMS